MNNAKNYLNMIQTGNDLSQEQAEAYLGGIIDNPEITDDHIKAMLTALTDKSPTVDEIVGFVHAMRARMLRIESPNGSIDMCGTGGDRSGTFNISTAASLIVASSGVPVAKHGNRAATSKCGSADVLEALHVPIELEPDDAEKSLRENGFVFLYAPKYHPALKRMSIIRKQLDFPTIFNLLGPLLNPAGVKRQIIGTYSLQNCELMSRVVQKLQPDHVVILTSDDGLDEAGLSAPVHLFEVRGDAVETRTINPEKFGFKPVNRSALLGDTPQINARIISELLDPEKATTPKRETAIFNAAIGSYVSGKVDDIDAGIAAANESVQNGNAKLLLNLLQSKG